MGSKYARYLLAARLNREIYRQQQQIKEPERNKETRRNWACQYYDIIMFMYRIEMQAIIDFGELAKELDDIM